MSKIKVSSIAAMAENRVIGRNNALIWHIPEDLKHFKRTTMGKPIIMGRKSYESLGKPLPGRANIVISRSGKPPVDAAPTALYAEMEADGRQTAAAEHASPPPKEGHQPSPPSDLHYVKSIEEAIELAKEIAAAEGKDEVFITGGGEIYKQSMDLIDFLYLTVVHRDYEGDTYFPEFNWDDWRVVEEQRHEGDPAFTFYRLERV